MASIWKLLSRVGSLPPEAFDAIFPQGPELVLVDQPTRFLGAASRFRGADDVMLNPQPLPPHEAAVGAALVGRLLNSAIIVVGGREESPGRAFLAEIDEWCGTGWPRRWPRPKPRGWDNEAMFTGAALYAAHLAAHYEHNPDMQEALGAAVDQLVAQVA